MEYEDKTYYLGRLKKEEIEYIKKHGFEKPIDYLHDSIKRDIELSKRNIRNNYFKDMNQYVVMLGIGAIFIVMGNILQTTNFWGFIILFLVGVFFMVTSLLNMLVEVKKRVGRTKT